MSQLTAIYRGRVQGVGFRATVCDIAQEFPVTGRVQNLPDGTVRMLAEGDENVLLEFHGAILDRFQRNIVDSQTTWSTGQAQFSDFNVAW